MQFGKMKQLNPKTTRQKETKDLAPWLAESLGMELKLKQTEPAVGNFLTGIHSLSSFYFELGNRIHLVNIIGLIFLFVVISSIGCTSNVSGIEGKAINGKNEKLINVKVIAKQVNPIKGYEVFETFTNSEGMFTFNKLFPSSDYSISVFTDQGPAIHNIIIKSGPAGKTSLLPFPFKALFVKFKNDYILQTKNSLLWVPSDGNNYDYFYSKTIINKFRARSSKIVGYDQWRFPESNEFGELETDMRESIRVELMSNRRNDFLPTIISLLGINSNKTFWTSGIIYPYGKEVKVYSFFQDKIDKSITLIPPTRELPLILVSSFKPEYKEIVNEIKLNNDYNLKLIRTKEAEDSKRFDKIEISNKTNKVFTEINYEFEIYSLNGDGEFGNDLNRLILKDINKDGLQDLIVSSFSGGAHCCYELYIFGLGAEFKNLFKLDGGSSGFQIKDINNDGIYEIITKDWNFAYWEAPYALSPATEIIFTYNNGKYILAIDLMRNRISDSNYILQLGRQIKSKFDKEDTSDGKLIQQGIPVDLWKGMLDLIYTGNGDKAFNLVDIAWPETKEGKNQFIHEFKVQLAKSKYWLEIKKMNNWK